MRVDHTTLLICAGAWMDGGDDVRIGTAADMPAYGFLDIVVAVTVRLIEQRKGRSLTSRDTMRSSRSLSIQISI
jgi:hypothetical protein